ncbi:hypothetical protein DTO013E5_10235 [Penicillium roqueforti]|nr:hypothetical protein DTO013F2_10498 [Penicillium roqueforti]KAI2734032.1 hypothetical protein DTO012A1_10258 [Penicillium roqueforti]KAI2761290.1 hypothetical protein DTO012A8_9620 [Penicillium roqueforti]KAI3072221.1 hypothetical protein CBS147339_6905 [Penicillium roqueforti]KAI3088548.1 hypothetical protein CBS147338_9963 [Penicillium roqueforti]
MADSGVDSGDDNPNNQSQFLPSGNNNASREIGNTSQPQANTMSSGNGYNEKNQATNLPDISAAKMQKVKALEYNSRNPRGWAIPVKFALAPLRLEYVIDSSMPRPTVGDPKFDRWEYWSRTVASWLYVQVDDTLQERIQNLSYLPEFADTMFDEIMLMVQGSDKAENALNETKKFDEMKRADFNTAKEFIAEYQKQYHVLSRFKIQPHPFHALSQVLRQLDKEISKVQFIIEEISNIEPKKITLEKMDQYCKSLQAVSDREGTANAAQSSRGRGNNRGGGRGGRGGKRGGKGGNSEASSSQDNKSSKDDSSTSNEPKKKKTLRNQPPPGKDIHEYVKEKKEGTQRDESGMCAYCGFGPHKAQKCSYLSEDPPAHWTHSPHVWNYSIALRSEGRSNMAITATARHTDSFNSWLIDTGSDKTLTHDFEDFYTYQEDSPESAYAYRDYSGNRVVTEGHGEVLVKAGLEDGTTYTFLTKGYYSPRGHGKLFGMQKLLEEQDISYDTRTKRLTDGTGKTVGVANTSLGVPYLIGPKEDDSHEEDSSYGSDSDEETGLVNKISAFEAHRRFGHAGKAKLTSTLKQAQELDDEEQYGTEYFDCEACFQGKSKKQISREPQFRVQDVAWKFHVDTQPMKPEGPNGEKYWMPILDDATRYLEGPTLTNKGEAFVKLQAFCEKIKLRTGRYPGIWRLDGGTEFKNFITWGTKKGMTFEVTPPYTAEPNGAVERFGGYVNDIQRTMIIDTKLPEELWPYAVETAIYTINRLTNPKSQTSPLKHWRTELGIDNPDPSLKHLRPWGTTVYVHIPKEKRVQARKAAPRSWKGHLMGYEGDNGHILKIWNPETRKITISRDVSFPQPGDEDQEGGVPVAPKPSKPPGDDDTNEISIPLIDAARTEPRTEIVTVYRQDPVTPSTIHLPTIQGSVSTIPETPVMPRRQRLLPAPRHTRSILGRLQRGTPIPKNTEQLTAQRVNQTLTPIQEETQTVHSENATPQTEQITMTEKLAERKANFQRRLEELTARINAEEMDMLEVHQYADSIEQDLIRETSSPRESTPREDTPSPEQTRTEYQYPFSSPTQQTPERSEQQIATQQTSTQDTYEAPRHAAQLTQTQEKITPIVPTAEPVTAAPTQIQEPSVRRSKRSNIGIPPERYQDPKQKLLNVEYEKQKRDVKRAEKHKPPQEGNAKKLSPDNSDQVDIDAPFMYNGKPLHDKDVDLPSSFKQAQKSPFWNEWKEAMEKQLDDLAAKRTWTLILKPPKAKVLPGQWRFTVKTNTRDEVYGFKARWVVCGNFQEKSDDSSESYAPVVSETMIKIVLTLIAVYGLEWRQVDFTAAYLNASRKDAETVYMRQPTGFEFADAEGNSKQWVCTLNQALFGLRDSAFLWNEEMDCKLRQTGFRPLEDDPCVYVKMGKNCADLTIMMIHVDDFIIAAPTSGEIDSVVKQLKKHYDMKDLGEPKQYLNCALDRDYNAGTIIMSQEAYVQKILRITDTAGTKETPLPPGWRESNPEDIDSNLLDDENFEHYQTVVGMLNWLAIKTRPDIRFAVTRLQHRLATPTFSDLEAMRHVVKYLRHNPKTGLIFGKSDELQFIAFTDASHADWTDSKSTEGCIWFFAGVPVAWSTKKQTITANSTTIAEWCALDQPARDAMWLAKVADSLSLPRPDPTVIYTDNINSQLLLTKKGGKSATRWLALRWFFVKDAVAQGHINILRVDTKQNAADGFTKALPKEQFRAFLKLIGMT